MAHDPLAWRAYPQGTESIMKTYAVTLFTLALALSSTALLAEPMPQEVKEADLEVPLESWVKRITVDSSRMTVDNCTHIERGTKVNLVNDLHWMPKLSGYPGILVIHPFSPKRPALIEMTITAADAGKYLKIAARGSDHEPGGKLHFQSNGKDLGVVEINSEWVETGVRIPAGITMMTLAWHPVSWYNEMLWVDSVEVVNSLPRATE